MTKSPVSQSSSWRHWRRSVGKIALPVVGLSLLAVLGTYTARKAVQAELDTSLLIRFLYASLFTIGMEYFARYSHLNAWHSNQLWFYHASHHHQKAEYGQGPTASEKELKANQIDTSAIELNDIFPVTFASIAICIIYWGVYGKPSLLKDCALGACGGISLFGTSYFIGHDLCAHERGGPALAALLRRLSPTMAHCAETHVKYHHSVSPDVADDEDPYGPPYGFWLGPMEVKDYLAGEKEAKGMPAWLRLAFRAAYAFMLYAAFDHFQLAAKLIRMWNAFEN